MLGRAMLPLAMLRMTHDMLEEIVHLFFIRQPFLSCWLILQTNQSLASEVKLSFWDELSISVYGMTKLNLCDQLSISVIAIKLVALFLIYGSKYFSIWDETRPEVLT